MCVIGPNVLAPATESQGVWLDVNAAYWTQQCEDMRAEIQRLNAELDQLRDMIAKYRESHCGEE